MNPVTTVLEALVHFEAADMHSPDVHLIVEQTNLIVLLTRQKVQRIQCHFKLGGRSDKQTSDILDFTIPSELDRQQAFVRIGLRQHMFVRFASRAHNILPILSNAERCSLCSRLCYSIPR